MADDLYRVLGIDRNASAREIRAAYRKLASEYHPDRRPGDRAAEERFRQVAYAKHVLLDPKKRALYDQYGEVGLHESFRPEDHAPSEHARGAGDRPAESQRVVGPDLMQTLRQQRWANRTASKQDLAAEVELELGEALRGVEKSLSFEVPDAGHRTVTTRIPAGVKHDECLRLRGQGARGGDLLLRVRVRPHRFFHRDGDDLHLRLPLSVAEAHRGTRVDIPTPDGHVSLQIPAGIESGSQLRVPGKGVARGSQRPGDLIVHAHLVLPTGEIDGLVDQLEARYTAQPRKDLSL